MFRSQKRTKTSQITLTPWLDAQLALETHQSGWWVQQFFTDHLTKPFFFFQINNNKKKEKSVHAYLCTLFHKILPFHLLNLFTSSSYHFFCLLPSAQDTWGPEHFIKLLKAFIKGLGEIRGKEIRGKLTLKRVQSERWRQFMFKKVVNLPWNELNYKNLISLDKPTIAHWHKEALVWMTHTHKCMNITTHIPYRDCVISAMLMYLLLCVSGLYVSALSKYWEASISHCCSTGNPQR